MTHGSAGPLQGMHAPLIDAERWYTSLPDAPRVAPSPTTPSPTNTHAASRPPAAAAGGGAGANGKDEHATCHATHPPMPMAGPKHSAQQRHLPHPSPAHHPAQGPPPAAAAGSVPPTAAGSSTSSSSSSIHPLAAMGLEDVRPGVMHYGAAWQQHAAAALPGGMLPGCGGGRGGHAGAAVGGHAVVRAVQWRVQWEVEGSRPGSGRGPCHSMHHGKDCHSALHGPG